MEALTSQGIIGFLVGTIGTIIIKGIVDWVNRRSDYKRELERYKYERKMEVALEVTKALNRLYHAFTSVKLLINEDIVEGVEEEYFNAVWESNFKEAIKAEKLFLNSGAHLHFNIESPDLWSEEDQTNLLRVFSSLSVWIDEKSAMEAEYEETKDEKLKEGISKYLRGPVSNGIEKEIGDLSKVLNKYLIYLKFCLDEVKHSVK